MRCSDRRRGASRAVALLSWGVSLVLGCAPAEPQSAPNDEKTELVVVPEWRPPTDAPTEVDYPALENLLQISPALFSGGEPKGEEAFASLAALGIRTVVSVDGATPKVALANRHGLRYVHIPIGYDGIDDDAGRALAAVARESEGPWYVHCHHGLHRGPAAAALVGRAEGSLTVSGGLGVLRVAGTSREYGGLWDSVEEYRLPNPGDPLPELVETAQVDSLAAAMAAIDRAYARLELCREAGWTTPEGHPDLVPVQEALLIKEGLRESARHLDGPYDERFDSWMGEAESEAQRLEDALRAGRVADAEALFRVVSASCTDCHDDYR